MILKRAMGMTVTVLAVAVLAMPLLGVRSRAAGKTAVEPAMRASALAPARGSAAEGRVQQAKGLQRRNSQLPLLDQPPLVEEGGPKVEGRLSDAVLKRLGIPRLKKGTDRAALNKRIADHILSGGRRGGSAKISSNGVFTPDSGQPTILNARSALSAAMITAIGGRDNQFSEVTLIADWDGREDCAADREVKVDDFSFVEPDIDFTITRTAISEHTIANGFNENIFYYGDSVGNVWIGADTDGDGRVDMVRQINLPTAVGIPTDDQITITGLAVNPSVDFGGPGGTGEVLWGSFTDSEGFRLGGGNVQRSGLFFILIDDTPDGGFPITDFGVTLFGTSTRSSPGGVAVDDNGDVYWHLTDLIQFTGGSIFKIYDIDGDRFPDVAFVPYSGTSTTFGNIVSITSGPCNTIYAAVSRSFVGSDDGFTQLTEGLFPAPSAFPAGTPSMIISFADCSGGFDACSGIAFGPGGSVNNVAGQLPIADHFADVAVPGEELVEGVNNFRVFALGNGPDIRPPAGQAAGVATSDTLKIDMQIDFTAHSGVMVDENNSVFVISGGTPAGIGTNPSPRLGEILCFEDSCPMDRRADFVDLRGDTLPNPPASGGNIGDGDSDRFDHIFYQAPIDQVTLTPAGLAGLARGFLRYTSRLAPAPIGPGVTLGSTARTLGDDATTEAAVIFEALDPGHQVAGGDDQNTPFRGDDDNGLGNPQVLGPLSGGFEFVFGGPVGIAGCVWNGFFLNSNGNITFGEGDTNPNPTVTGLREGPPKIAPAWADLNPNAQAVNPQATPLLAIGFSGVNSFKIRWINVPEFGNEDCGGFDIFGFPLNPASNTFSVTLYDDGTGIDENSNKLLDPGDQTGDNVDPTFNLQEGPTDLRFTREPVTQVVVGCSPRRQGSGVFVFDYCRMDLLGTSDSPVITGYSIGGLDPLNPPGLCETNLSEAARAAETTFGVIDGQTAAIGCDCLLGEGTEPTIFELFNEGRTAGTGAGGEITFATPDFDLRFEGNDPAACTPNRQRDLNRGRVGFLGIGCAPPENALCQVVVPGPFATTPNAGTDLVDALCAVQLNIVGCGFFPNEATIICQGFEAETGVPLQRPGKTVTTAATLACDTNGDGIAESVVALVNVTPVSCNLVTATIPVSASFGPNSTSGFPAACCGGTGTVTVTTTFTSGDNNVFGPFTRTAVCSIALGVRAPIVFSVTPSDGNCAVVPQDLLISGACFIIPQGSITSVFAINRATGARIDAIAFQVLNNNLIDADFNFGSANAGNAFLIFVQGPGGISRNITTAVAGSPAGCPLGNEQGIQVTFTCNSVGQPGGPGTPGSDIAVLTRCELKRNTTSGKFTLEVFGTNIKQGASVTLNGQVPPKVKFKDLVSGTTNTFTRIILAKKVCASLNGSASIVVTNPGTAGGPSAPLLCTARCPTN